VAVLRRIVEKFGGRMALDCEVIEPGLVSEGDPVDLVEKYASTRSASREVQRGCLVGTGGPR